jgi:hypothetical protein
MLIGAGSKANAEVSTPSLHIQPLITQIYVSSSGYMALLVSSISA